MENKTPPVSSDIPDFKLQKVGKEREKRKGGLPWFPQFGRAGQGAFATGGAGSAGGAGARGIAALLLGSKAGIFALTAAIAAGAWSYGKLFAPDYARYQDSKKPKVNVGASKDGSGYNVDASKLPGAGKQGGSGLDMVSGSLGNKAAEDAAAAEAAKAAEDAAKAGQADASGDAPAVPEVPQVPGADAAGPPPETKPGPGSASGLASRPGGLSSGLGGSSGAGMSGGVGRGFDAIKRPDAGKLGGMRGGPAVSRSAGGRAGAVAGRDWLARKSFGKRQLDKAANLSNAATKGSGENRSSYAAAAFDNNKGEGQSLEGSGAGVGGNPNETAPDTSFGDNASGPVNSGPAPAAEKTCDAGKSPDGKGGCVDLCKGGTKWDNAQGGCVGTGTDKDPTSWIVDMVKYIMDALAILLLFIMIYQLTPYTWGIAKYLQWAVGILGGVLATLGLVLVGMGRPILGWVATGIGALAVTMAVVGMAGAGQCFVQSFWGWAGMIAIGAGAGIAGFSDSGSWDNNTDTNGDGKNDAFRQK
ncbi:MAG: hypothetical protein HY927_10190 [Elusimicrobia bacterium]|nr:hypothetical protein [Elusimicrobiota bacterium]